MQDNVSSLQRPGHAYYKLGNIITNHQPDKQLTSFLCCFRKRNILVLYKQILGKTPLIKCLLRRGKPVKKSLQKQFIQRTVCFKPPGK